MKPFLTVKFDKELKLIREKEFNYEELPIYEMLDNKEYVMIHGYFQSYKYFEQDYAV